MSDKQLNEILTSKLMEFAPNVKSVEDCDVLGMTYRRVTFRNKTLTMSEIEKIITILQDITKADQKPIDGKYWAIGFKNKSLIVS